MARFIKNRSEIAFADPAADGTAPTHVFLYTAETSGTLLLSKAVATTVTTPNSGNPVKIPAKNLTITIGVGDGTDDLLELCLGGIAAAARWVGLGTDASTEMTTTEYPNYARKQIASGTGAGEGWIIESS